MRLWWNLRCRFFRVWLDSYVRRELPAGLQRPVAQHLRACAACRAEYEQRAPTIRALSRELPTVGRPHRSQLEAMWHGIEQHMAQPQPANVPRGRVSLLIAALLFSMVIASNRHAMPALRLANDPPPVARLALTPTPTSSAAPARVAPVLLVLQNTPNTSSSE